MTTIPLHWTGLAAATVLSIALLPGQVLAASPRIPASLYPAHTRITSISPLTNGQMDCDWGFACYDAIPLSNAPIFHLRTQDDLHRLSGWAQFGDGRQHHHRMLFASRYSADDAAGMPWNVAAFSDFRGALMTSGFEELERVPRLLPRGEVGNTSAQLARSADGDVLAMACWTGSIEVEGMALYAHGSPSDRQVALRYLTREIRAAVKAA